MTVRLVGEIPQVPARDPYQDIAIPSSNSAGAARARPFRSAMTHKEGLDMNATANLAVVTRHVGRVAALIAMAVGLFALAAAAQTAKEVKGPTPLVAVANEAPAKLIVDPPIPEQLAQGRVFIQYRTENLRVLPVFGNAALTVSPRLGHLHYYVDDQSWPTVDSSGETVVLVGLKPGPHKVKLELADATHKAIPGADKVLEFAVPPRQ